MDGGIDAQAERYTVLEDPQRRAIYLSVRQRHRPVTREEIAAATGVSRKLAAFHLERLLDAGLLRADYARPAGVGGPGAGRPPKRYQASGADITLEIPTRQYALAGRLLARAIDRSAGGRSSRAAAMQVAADEGRRLGAAFADGRPGGGHSRDDVLDLLADVGFEPVVDGDEVVLANCPFHALAETSRDLVCGMNEALVRGMVEGMGVDELHARLSPEDGRCCIVLNARRQ
jgi:predicted ArsR family transcriptional regulator